jgi:ubiquinone/menaquinone biosynthesis C-methylase UbiE
MAFYRNHIYPHLVNSLGNPPPIRDIRSRLVPVAQGAVLEIGVGSGFNFAHYDPERVTKVYALEPNPGMRRLAEEQSRRRTLPVEFLSLPAERIPLGDCGVDTVVSTFTLCTIGCVTQAIQGLKRVLRSGGKFVFFENSLSPQARVQIWQKWTEPVTRCLFAGCYITRDIPALISEHGFKIEQIEAGYLAPFPKAWSYCSWGIATNSPK